MIAEITRKVRRLLTYTKANRKELFGGLIFASLDQLIAVWMIADLLGNCAEALETGDFSLIIKAVLSALPWLAGIIALNAIAQYLYGISTAKAAAAMRSHLLDVMLNTSLGKSITSHSGVKLSYFTNDINAAFESLIATLAAPISSVVVGMVCLIYVLYVHWAIALIAAGIGLLVFLYSIILAKHLHKIAVKMQRLLAVLESRMKDLLDSMVVSRIFGMRERLEDDMDGASNNLCREGIHWARASGVLGAFNNAFSALSEKGLVFAAGLFLFSDLLSLPDLFRVVEMAGGIIGVFHLSRTLVAIQRSMAGAQRVFDVMDSAEREPSGTVTRLSVRNPIMRFSGVSFGYNRPLSVLSDFSLDVTEGELIVLAGPSGSGKSTILRLAQGLYTPAGGLISFMGIPVSEWDTAVFRSHMSLAPQEPVLFPGTVAANIAIGDKNPDKNRIIKAAELAFAHGFITDMNAGYETPIAERGASLSGGQRQRIAIARALYRDAPVLLLDEVTSAMDSEAEAAVHATLCRLKGKKTILYVSHRKSACRIADRIVTIGG